MRASLRTLLIGLMCLHTVTGCDTEPIPAAPEGPTVDIPGRVIPPGTGGSGGSGVGGMGGIGGATGACTNAIDREILLVSNVPAQRSFCNGNACAGMIANAPAYENCVTGCIAAQLPGLSIECSACYGALAGCGFSNFCLESCQFTPCGQLCLDCLRGTTCLEEFRQCSGLPGDGC